MFQLAQHDIGFAFSQSFLHALLPAFFLPTSGGFHNFLPFLVLQFSDLLLQLQFLLRIEPKISVDESGEKPLTRFVQLEGGKQAEAFKFDLCSFVWLETHLRHQRAGDWIAMAQEVAPIEPFELNDAKSKAQNFAIGKFDPVAVGFGPKLFVREDGNWVTG